MNDLDKLYREAPQLESPPALDNTILRAAEARKPESNGAISWWQTAGYAMSFLCVVGVGLGVLLQSGFIPTAPISTPSVSSSAAPGRSHADVAVGADLKSTRADENIAVQQSKNTVAEKMPLAAQRQQLTVHEENDLDQTVALNIPAGDDLQGGESYADSLSPAATASVTQSTTSLSELNSVTIERESVVESGRQNSDTYSVPITDTDAVVTVRSLEWLRRQPANSYAVQLAAAAEQKHLLAVAQRLSTASEIVKLDDSAAGWLLLLSGFIDRVQAQQALDSIQLQPHPETVPEEATIVLQIVSFEQLQDRVK